MKFTVIAMVASLATAGFMQPGADTAPIVGNKTVVLRDDTKPWYEQARELEQAKAIETPVIELEAQPEIVEPETPAVPKATDREIGCMEAAIHYEARGEPLKGRIAVVEVVLARRASGKWPANACSVIAQPSQFSFVRGGRIPAVPEGLREIYRELVLDVLNGRVSSSAKGATFFHAKYARPSWRHKFKRIATIGQHLFYRS